MTVRCVRAMDNSKPTETPEYTPPLLRELGGFSALTHANGNHFGKVTGGTDALVDTSA
jgi:hypothetical protein